MKTVSVEIKIPDGHEVAEVSIVWPGYDVSPTVAVGQMVVKTKVAKPFLINGVLSDWPEWLVCDWVAKHKSGDVFGYLGGTPHKRQAEWGSGGASQMLSAFTALEVPGPWDQSLRENPRRKK